MSVFKKLLASSLLVGSVYAADHLDSPLVTNDPAADLNDIYAFVNPNDASELIVIATMSPIAGPTTQFSDAVEYRFHIANNASPSESHEILCSFPNVGTIECTGPSASAAGGLVGQINSGQNMRVYAGLRDDPFYFDLGAFTQTVATLTPQFTNPGTDFFEGLNTLAIVVGIDSDILSNEGADSTLKVYASTNRVGGTGITGSITGSFYDPEQSGHGFFVEAIDVNGETQVFVAWFVFDTEGNPLWLSGVGSVDGNVATVPVTRSSGGFFPPNFDPDAIVSEAAGSLVFTFDSCNLASVDFQSVDETSLGSVTIPVSRLTSIQGLPCQLLTSGQIDRMGRPAITAALIDLLASTGLKEVYNQAQDPTQWASMFQSEMKANLEALDTLDGTTGNALLDSETLSSVLVDDRLNIDVSQANCDVYLAVELGVTDQCGGRTLERDVMDDTLGAVVGPGVSDGVSNTSTFLDDFPFLGNPNN